MVGYLMANAEAVRNIIVKIPVAPNWLEHWALDFVLPIEVYSNGQMNLEIILKRFL